MPTAVHATAADLDEVTAVLTAAFAQDPVQRWLFAAAPDPVAGVAALMGVFVPDYFWLGHTLVVAAEGDLAGAALWSPPDRNPLQGDRVEDLFAALAPHLGDDLLPRLGELARAAEHRPSVPHFYLGILGVDPARRGRGLGSALLAPVLAECDRTGAVAHLESSNPRNIGLYERHGFRVVHGYRCGEAIGEPDGPVMTIMTRSPR